jgi:hypothetical protein
VSAAYEICSKEVKATLGTGWVGRVGPVAARHLARSRAFARRGQIAALASVVSEIGFQLGRIKLGVELSTLLLLASVLCLGQSIRLQTQARRAAGVHLGMTGSSWKATPLRSLDRFDRWLDGRNLPGWRTRVRRPTL